MQEESEQKSFNIMISTTKLSARTVLRAVKAAFRLYQSKASQGKQSVRTLLRQNRGVSSVEISKTGIRGLERYAKKYGIDYAIRKDSSEVPPRYLVFFKAPDAEAFHSAFKEYSASLLNKDKRPSVLAKLHELVQAATELPGKVRHKEQDISVRVTRSTVNRYSSTSSRLAHNPINISLPSSDRKSTRLTPVTRPSRMPSSA